MSRFVSVVCLVACMSLIPTLGFAKEAGKAAPAAGAQATPKASGQTAPPCARMRDLVSQEERTAHRAKMQGLKTVQEREAAQKEWRAQLEARAAKQGKKLCGGAATGGGPGMGMGMGPGPRGPKGPGMGRGKGPGGPPGTQGTTPPAGDNAPTPETPAPSPPAGGGTPQQ